MNSKFLMIALLLLLSSPAYALMPAGGLWWNPSLSGSGFQIELQGSTMSLTVYSYDADGAPLWYLAAGEYDDATSTFASGSNTFSGGQCLGCAYTSPVAAPAGDFSIMFTDAEHATISFPGGSYPIEHFAYGYASKLDYLLGEWVFTQYRLLADGTSTGSSEWIIFDSHLDQGDGAPLVTGHGDGTTGVTASGSYDAPTDTFTVSITVSTPDPSSAGTFITSTQTYTLQGDDRSMRGSASDDSFFPGPTLAAAFRLSF